MTLPDDTSRLVVAWRELSERARAFEACPDPERIWDAACGELDSTTTRELVEHIGTCPACAEAWRLARELPPSEQARDSAVTSGTSRLPAWNLGRIAIAAMIVLAVGLASRLDRPGEETIERGSGVAVESLLPPGTALPRSDFRLRWRPGPEGTRYDLLLTTGDLVVVAQVRDLSEPQYLVPTDTLETISANSELLWRVEMVLPDGRHVASPAFVVRIE